MKMTIEFKAKLRAGISYDESAEVYVTYAPALDIYSQGVTKKEAKEALKDAVASFLVVSYRKRALEQFLKSADLCKGEEYIKVEDKIKTMLFELVDGAKIVVETTKIESPAQEKWKREWVVRANYVLDKYDKGDNMTKYFCDCCGEEITNINATYIDNYASISLSRVRGNYKNKDMTLNFEIMTGLNGMQNLGHFCKYCVIDAVNSVDDRIKK